MVAAQLRKNCMLLLGLNTFRNCLHAQMLCQGQDCRDHIALLRVLIEFGDETPVDFNALHAKASQIGQGGLARSKIIEVKIEPVTAQLVDIAQYQIVIAERRDVLKYLNREPFRLETMAICLPFYMLGHRRLAQLIW